MPAMPIASPAGVAGTAAPAGGARGATLVATADHDGAEAAPEARLMAVPGCAFGGVAAHERAVAANRGHGALAVPG